MSTNTVQTILSRAMSDPNFAEELLADPEKALSGYDLTVEEIAQFRGLTRAEFAAMTTGERKSFGGGFWSG